MHTPLIKRSIITAFGHESNHASELIALSLFRHCLNHESIVSIERWCSAKKD